MFKVECPGCKAPYQVDERRVPPKGLSMRCPKCGTSFHVEAPPPDPRGASPSPVLVAPSGPVAGGERPKPKLKGTMIGVAPPLPRVQAPKAKPTIPRPKVDDDEPGLPAPRAVASPVAAPSPSAPTESSSGLSLDLPDLPAVGNRNRQAPPRKAPPVQEGGSGLDLADIDLPMAPSPKPTGEFEIDLPSRANVGELPDLPSPAAAAAGADLPVVAPPQQRRGALGDLPPTTPARRLPEQRAPEPEIGLPIIASSAHSGAARSQDSGELDLDLELPTVGGGPDLPSLREAGLPSPRGGEIELPSPRAAAKGGRPPPPTRGDLPAVTRARATQGGFGELDLPMVGAAGLPSPARAELPSPAAQLPSPAAQLPSPAAQLPSLAPDLPLSPAGIPEPPGAEPLPDLGVDPGAGYDPFGEADPFAAPME